MTRCWNDVSLGRCSARSRFQIARPCESPPEWAWWVAALASCQRANSPQTSAVSSEAAVTNRAQRGGSARPERDRATSASTTNRPAANDALCTSSRNHDTRSTIVRSRLSATKVRYQRLITLFSSHSTGVVSVGRVIVAMAPPPGRLSSWMVPPCSSTTCLTMASPSPEPGSARASSAR